MRYRRNRAAGASYFLTLVLADRHSALLTRHIALLREALRHVKTRHPFILEAIVILPDHMHMLITLPEKDDDYPKRIMLIKQHFSRHIPRGEKISTSRMQKGERGIWQRRYWEHTIHNDEDFARCMNYIHMNPVKHGYVQRAADWPHSSLPRYIREGIYAPDWMSLEDFSTLKAFDA